MADKTCEIVVDEKTYVTKKMNPKRRGLVLRRIVSQMSGEDTNIAISKLFETELVEVIWEFIADEDKKDIGTKEKLSDDIDDESAMLFLKWALEKVNEISDFLPQAKSETKKV